MSKLANVPASRLRDALGDAETAKAAKRLMVALAYKDGVHVDTISARYGIPKSTVYYWLDRIEKQPLADALHDQSRPGRPPKLTATQRTEVESWLDSSPHVFGHDAETWTAELLREQIEDNFETEYSTAHVHRLFFD